MGWSISAVASLAPGAQSVSLTGSHWDVLSAILAAGPVVKGVMLILLLFSVISWAIIIAKSRQLTRARRENTEFFKLFWATPDLASATQATDHLAYSPAALMFRETLTSGPNPGPMAGNPQQDLPTHPSDHAIHRALRRSLSEQGDRLSRSLSFLATCGNTAPFIGLFGTVWGIMTSFHDISLKGSASLATVAPGIAEALIATAAGLVVAIPAVMAYNYFLGQVRRLEAELADFATDLAPLLNTSEESQPLA
ncbi:MAG: MotA/TolQ/ExbB proton channel family protein [Syntrophobacterales bacterium]|jgi:biopolymer transport protein TolQ